ncbi:MAG: hypothetical protein UY72_C0031G0002 [Candidatus Uhrbacteria bacterium GW2011_GWD2_52_7]|uniref:Uncharacterized protein n=1 Tax=Candidatus Uhrbacteria bacterium GW2011_GWD2_52_7 TaxID=1618989 RepID=A0A0G1XFZ8_9BACT|nr:MAG: hypothetical protein UY72_C0031G0002 [Candidatus Uhrbacteria bacterium GW2011_GWD2_52_7]
MTCIVTPNGIAEVRMEDDRMPVVEIAVPKPPKARRPNRPEMQPRPMPAEELEAVRLLTSAPFTNTERLTEH